MVFGVVATTKITAVKRLATHSRLTLTLKNNGW